MDLLINAFFITFGVVAALAFFAVSYRLLQIAIKLLLALVEQRQIDEMRAARLERARARQDKINAKANELLSTVPGLADLVNELRETPYIDKSTKAARENNNKRSRLQKSLRELVADRDIRDVYYSL